MAGEIIILSAEGGGSLNYEVVSGTSTPSSPSANTIWVNTSTAITSHVFSSTKPSSPSAGMVWFNIGTSSPAAMNVLEDDDKLYIYPTGCMQYVSSAWVSKTAQTYIDGAWVSWLTYLYNNGDNCSSLTGGWSTKATGVGEGSAVAPSVSNNTSTGVMTITQGTATSGGIAYMTNKINLSGYKTLTVKGTFTNMNTLTKLYLWSSLGTTQSASVVASQLLSSSSTVITLDISSLSTTTCYVGFGLYSYTGALATLKITEISLSK